MDACLIAGGQRAEHYEMAAYGTAIAWAEALELDRRGAVLRESLEEEKAADEKLSALAESGINEAATAGESEDDRKNERRRSKSAAEVGSHSDDASASAATERRRVSAAVGGNNGDSGRGAWPPFVRS